MYDGTEGGFRQDRSRGRPLLGALSAVRVGRHAVARLSIATDMQYPARMIRPSRITALLLGCITSLSSSVVGAQSTALADHPVVRVGTAVVGGITAEATVAFDATNHYSVTYRFKKGGAGRIRCLSSYLDIHYELRDATGTVVPVDADALKRFHSIDGATSTYQSGYAGPTKIQWTGTPPPACPYFDPLGQKVLLNHALLADIYPRLGPGTYTLALTFAPRGVKETAAFLPALIHVDEQHPI